MKPYGVHNTTHYLHSTYRINVQYFILNTYITIFTRGFYANDDDDDTRHTHTHYSYM